MFSFRNANDHLIHLLIAIMAIVGLAIFLLIFGVHMSSVLLVILPLGVFLVPSILVYQNHKKYTGKTLIELSDDDILVKSNDGNILHQIDKYEVRGVAKITCKSLWFTHPVSDLSYLIVKLPDGKEFYCSSFHDIDLERILTVTDHKEYVLPLMGKRDDLEWKEQLEKRFE